MTIGVFVQGKSPPTTLVGEAEFKTLFDLQSGSTSLDSIAGITPTDSVVIVGDGATWVGESGNTARTSLGVGTGDSPQFTGLTATGNVSFQGDTTIGNASADTLTINAGTWTIGNKYTATRAAGVAAAGLTFFGTWSTSFSGDAGGTTNGRALLMTTDVQGANSVAQGRGLQQNLENQLTAGTLALAVCNTSTFNNTSASNTTEGIAYASQISIQSTGNVATGINYSANAPALTGTGTFTTLSGFRSADLGHATLVTNAIGHQADNMTVSATLTASFRSQQNSGTGAWGFLHTGTANNAFNGNVRIGSTTAPTVALDVTGSAIISGNTTLGDASADTLTINAGTWTLGSNYVATRDAGAAAAGQSIFADIVYSASGDAGGTSDFRGERVGLATTGSNNITRGVGLNARAINQSTGTVSTLVANLYSAGSDTTVTSPIVAGCLGDIFIINTGNITNAFAFRTPAPFFSSTGNITNMTGFSVADIGNATRITNSISFLAENQTISGTSTISFSSLQNSGTGAWGFRHTGTANNAFNGNVRIGSTTAPTVALDVTGAVYASTVVKTGGYTVATLPAGVVGMRAYVTDATAPAFLVALVGGGAVTCPAFYNGAAWVAG